MKKPKVKKIILSIILAICFIYVFFVLISQQKTLNTYKTSEKEYADKIETATETKNELTKLKENIDSPEYIEELARKKLDMYLPNERVYIDAGK